MSPTKASPPFGVRPPAKPIWPPPAPKTKALTKEQQKALNAYTGGVFTGGQPVSSSGSWCDPVRWWDDYVGFTISSFDDVKSWVLNLAKDVGNLVHEDVTAVWHDAESFTADTVRYAMELGRDAEQDIDRVGHDLVSLFDRVRHDAASWFDDLTRDLVRSVDFLGRYARALFEDLWRDVLDRLWRDAVRPIALIWHWIDGAEHWLYRHLDSWWDEIWRLWVAPVVRDFKALVHRVEVVERYLYGDVRLAVKVVEECSEWLLWMARHAPGDFEAAAELVGEETFRRWLKDVAGA